MSLGKLVVDLLGAGFEIYLSLLLYSLFMEIKPLSKTCFSLGLCGIALLNILSIHYLQGLLPLPVFYVLFSFLISLYFEAHVLLKLLLSFCLSAAVIVLELIVGLAMMWVTGLSVEHIQSQLDFYATALFLSKLIALFLVEQIRRFKPSKSRYFNKIFSMLMLILPAHAMFTNLIVYSMAGNAEDVQIHILSMLTSVFSFLLLVVTGYIIMKYIEGEGYKQKYELSQLRLQARMEHSRDNYMADQEIRGIKHDIGNRAIILYGYIKAGKNKEALEYLEDIQTTIRLSDHVINTGYTAIDSILHVKTKEAKKKGIQIICKPMLEGDLYIDEMDIALLLANGLDNAVEAVEKGDDANRDIRGIITSNGGYISIVIENSVPEAPNKRLKTTKADKVNHGFGLSQMQAIAEKYDGALTAEYRRETQTFCLQALLKNR